LSEECRPEAASVADDHRRRLRADCARCFGLCCVASAFAASADFAIDKDAGQPCPHLRPDFGCAIHNHLRQRGFPGCAAYDCFGAGQQVAQVTFGGRDWRQSPETATRMFAVFTVMRQLHELLWYLGEALTMRPARSLWGELRHAREEIQRLTESEPDVLAGLEVDAYRRGAAALLRRTSELMRAGTGVAHTDFSGIDLIGKDFRGAGLAGANLRGALLVGTDLRDADLRMADVLGADFRGANLGGADLSTSIFLIQAQLEAAKGDSRTKLPPSLTRPTHWA